MKMVRKWPSWRWGGSSSGEAIDPLIEMLGRYGLVYAADGRRRLGVDR